MTAAPTGTSASTDDGSRSRPKRADALRNIEAIIDAATRLLAVDPDASVNDIAKAAGVGRITLYGHFESRAALVQEATQRAIAQTEHELAQIDTDGEPVEALGRLLESSWHLTYRFGGLVVAASQAMSPAQMRGAHDEPAARVRSLLERGRAAGGFRDDMSTEWQITVVQAIMHSASAAVHRGEITADDAPTLVRETVLGALAA